MVKWVLKEVNCHIFQATRYNWEVFCALCQGSRLGNKASNVSRYNIKILIPQEVSQTAAEIINH